MSSGTGSETIPIGRLLQEARSAKGLTIEAAAAASKVSLPFVRLMEEEQFHLIPDPMYILRFLSEYSTSLGLDPKQVETQFRRQMKSPMASAPPQAAALTGSRINVRRLLLYLVPAAAAIPLMFIVLSLFSGRPPELPSSGRPPQFPSPQETAPQPPPGGGVDPSSPQEPPLAAAAAKGPNPAQPVAALGAGESQPEPSRYTLKAEAKETTWLAMSADGAARQQAVLRPGEVAQWSADKGFVVTIGNSGGIALSLNGKPVTLERGPGSSHPEPHIARRRRARDDAVKWGRGVNVNSLQDNGPSVHRRLKIGIVLNLLFALTELVAGLAAGSLALLGDAWHNFGDVIGLVVSWVALRQVERPATEHKTFGYHRATILAALGNGVALILITLWLFYEAIRRLKHPELPGAAVMMAVAGIGFVMNLALAFSLRRKTRDVNIRSAYLHLLSDACVSLGVVAAGAIILLTGWSLIDPLLSLVIGLLILVGSWDIVAETLNVLMEGVPRGVDVDRLLQAVQSFPEVKDTHDLHVWSLSSHVYAMSCHLQVADLPVSQGNQLLDRISQMLKARFGIAHTTIQLEADACPPQEACALNALEEAGSPRTR